MYKRQAQYDESANLKEYRVGEYYSGDLKFHRPPFREQFSVGLSLRAELVMPVFSINVGVGLNLIYCGDDTKGLYQVLALKTYVCLLYTSATSIGIPCFSEFR